MKDQTMIVNVAVATLWTQPGSPEEVDQPALQSPVDIHRWLLMSLDDRLSLFDKDKNQTQVLFGTKVIVEKVEGDWAQVLVPDQPTIKNEQGYPGWIPLRQLSHISEDSVLFGNRFAVVSSNTTFLYYDEQTQDIEISYLTRLPIIEESDQWMTVATPLGNRLVKTVDVKTYSGAIPQGTGHDIVASAKRFLGLPYLWGGTSAFGYDCSGFAYSMHKACGINIPRDASNQAKAGKEIEASQLLPGDLVFFAFEEGKGRVHHVGIYIGEGQMIHAPKTGKTVEIIPIKGSPYEIEHCISRRYW